MLTAGNSEETEVNIIGFSIISSGDVAVYCGHFCVGGVSNCVLTGGQAGMFCYVGSRTGISNTIITACGGAGVVVDDALTLSITNCIFIENWRLCYLCG